ncbi:LysR family transcriptional regulator [Mesorhizobium sp. SB112]|uniref:LysR family transcriptional regulator n=1 Tax=Mesorhizobium sp. SB112 TaxID=3151853 RepID=UPI0032659929
MLDALTLDQIRMFVAVVDAGSFRSGAARLSRVQSGISSAIANFEANLGVTVFDRSGHRPVLTSQGAALLTNARDILLRVDTMRARAVGMGEGVELELSLVIDPLFPIDAIGTALIQMRHVYPSVTIRLAVEPLGGPISSLLQTRSHLAIIVGEDFRDPRVVMTAISSVKLVAVASTVHPLAIKGETKEIGLPDLADHIQVVLSDRTSLSEGRDFGVLSPQTCRVDGQDTKHAMIVSGLGWGRLPLWRVERDLDEGRLVRLNTQALGRKSQVKAEAYLASRLDNPPGPAGRAFGEALRNVVSHQD